MVRTYYKFRTITDFTVATSLTAVCGVMSRGNSNLFAPLQKEEVGSLLLNIFTTAASLMGFVLAAGTFLISHVQHKTFEVLRASRSSKELPRIIEASIWRLFGLTCSSIVALLSGYKL